MVWVLELDDLQALFQPRAVCDFMIAVKPGLDVTCSSGASHLLGLGGTSGDELLFLELSPVVSMRSVLGQDGFSMHPFCTLSLLYCILLALPLWHFPTVFCMIVCV